MNKLIIDSRTDLSDMDALSLVNSVINLGRISNDDKQYCYLSIIKLKNKSYAISTDLNKRSDRFVILEYAFNDYRR